MITPDQLIPPDSELAHLLAQWTEDTDTRTWNVANLTNDLIEELDGGVATKADVYKAVATRCKGKKPDTIRRWAETAADFDKDTQEQYAQLLSFDHFKIARRLFKEGHSPYINYVLEWAVEGNDMKLGAGRFHTVGQILNHFLPQFRDANPLQLHWNKAKEKLYDQFILVENDTYRQELVMFWHEIDLTVQKVCDNIKVEAK